MVYFDLCEFGTTYYREKSCNTATIKFKITPSYYAPAINELTCQHHDNAGQATGRPTERMLRSSATAGAVENGVKRAEI